MELVIAGLGRMGANMARRLHDAGHRVVAYNRSRREDRRRSWARASRAADTPAEVVGHAVRRRASCG